MRYPFRLVAAMAVLIISTVSCSGNSAASRDAHLRKGDDFLAKKQSREAVLEYRAAVQADPMSGLARQKLGETYLAAGDTANAMAELVNAADLLPNDLQAQIMAARLLMVTGRYEDARGRAEKALALDPAHMEAQVLKGSALAGLKDFDAALKQIEGALRMDPSSSMGFANLGALQQVRGDTALAEAAFKRAVFVDPKSVTARLALANLYWSTNRKTEAEASLVEALKLDPTNVLSNRALAMLYLGSNREAMAEGPLKVIAANSPTAEGRIGLADYYVLTRRLPEAKALYVEISKGSDLASVAKIRLVSLGQAGDRAEAYRLIDEVLSKEPQNVEAMVARAQLQFGDGKPEALATARQAVALGPESPHAHLVLGRILASQNQFEDAVVQLKESLRANPQFLPASLALARLSQDLGKPADTVQFARVVLQSYPTHGEANLLLASAQLALGDTAAAQTTLKRVAAANPDVPSVQAEMGRLLYLKADYAGARRAFEHALSGDKSLASAIEGLVALDVSEKGLGAGRKRLDDAVAAQPANGRVLVMAGRTYSTIFKDQAAAEQAAKRAINADANNLAAFDLLARLYVQANNLPAATAEFEKLAERLPKSVANQTAVGMLLQAQNRLDEAKARYEKALAVDPRAAVAANNLAQIYVDRNENLEVALTLAQTAKAGLPKAHEIDDTLGWIHYRLSHALPAITSLKLAVAAQPENAVYLYHLGAAYALNKDNLNARKTLEKALARQATFPGADDARRILDSLK